MIRSRRQGQAKRMVKLATIPLILLLCTVSIAQLPTSVTSGSNRQNASVYASWSPSSMSKPFPTHILTTTGMSEDPLPTIRPTPAMLGILG